MKIRLLFLLAFAGLLLFSCNSTESKIEDDAMKLIKMEKKIVDLTIQLKKEDNPTLVKERDSISDELQELSFELQKKYKEADLTKEFQETYDRLKRKKKK
jgi:predicted secreted Zn-dependent protease